MTSEVFVLTSALITTLPFAYATGLLCTIRSPRRFCTGPSMVISGHSSFSTSNSPFSSRVTSFVFTIEIDGSSPESASELSVNVRSGAIRATVSTPEMLCLLSSVTLSRFSVSITPWGSSARVTSIPLKNKPPLTSGISRPSMIRNAGDLFVMLSLASLGESISPEPTSWSVSTRIRPAWAVVGSILTVITSGVSGKISEFERTPFASATLPEVSKSVSLFTKSPLTSRSARIPELLSNLFTV